MNADRKQRANIIFIAVMIGAASLIIIDRTGLWPALRPLTNELYVWGAIFAAVAIILGMLNVGWIHMRRIVAGERYWMHSAALIVALLTVLAAGLLNPGGVESPLVEWFFDSIIAPGQATLLALLVFFMAAAAYLYLRVDRPGGAWMLLGALLIMTAQAPVSGVWMSPRITETARWALDAPIMATMRGVLIGGGIVSIVVSFRFLYRSR